MNISQEFAREVLGERGGRSVSRIMGTGLSQTLGVSQEAGTDLAHALMALAALSPKARPVVIAGLGLALLKGY